MDSEAKQLLSLGDNFHVFNFIREVLTCCILPELENTKDIPEDIRRLADFFRSWCDGYSMGSYNPLQGIQNTLDIIEGYISQRDDIPYANTGQVMIAAGMEISLTHILPLLPGCHGDGTHAILVPGPTYPTIIDSIEVAGFRTVTYFLNEKDDKWILDIADLSEALEKSPHPVMSIFVQNPGYPTGHIHDIDELQTIIRFAKKNKLIIFAIENFQLDIHDPEEKPFVSMRKVLLEMGSEFESVQLLSFFSPNKSIIGEPGMSVTYIDTLRFDKEVFEKLVDLTLSPPVIQQIYVSLLLSPVAFLEYPSFKEFHKEKEDIIKRIARIAKLVTSFFNSQPYITCTKPHAGQTVFAKLEFPQSWTYIGPRSSASLEEFYCQQLRDATQVPIIAGKFFSEFPGSSHFKFSFPVDEVKLLQKLDQFKTFHQKFIMTMVK